MKKRSSPKLKLRTALSLNKTKPYKAGNIAKLKKALTGRSKPAKVEMSKPTPPVSEETSQRPSRVQPKSQIAKEHALSLWFIPARLAFFLNGAYFLSFSVMAFLGVFSNYKIIKPFFTLPFDTNFSSFFLLEIAAVFGLLASLLYFHAARHPRTYRWFYFFVILIFIPYHFLSNLQKLQIELPQDFQNYLYFDTIAIAIFWGMFLLSLYPYLKSLSRKP